MTLYQIISTLQNIAKVQPNIRSYGEGDIYEFFNGNPSLEYSTFFITQGQHSSNENMDNYNLTLFFVDRLLDDESNKLQIQSEGKSLLQNVITIFCENYDAESETIQYQPFTQRFSDLCAGVYATVTFSVVKDSLCPEDGGYNPKPSIIIKNQTKELKVTSNGLYSVTPDAGYTGLDEVKVNVEVAGGTVDTYTKGEIDDMLSDKAEWSALVGQANDTNEIFNAYDEYIVQNTAEGGYAHAEGEWTYAGGRGAHAEGCAGESGEGPSAYANGAHAEGMESQAFGEASHSEGLNTRAEGHGSHAEGGSSEMLGIQGGRASGDGSHAEGQRTIANSTASHSEGISTIAGMWRNTKTGELVEKKPWDITDYETVCDGAHAQGTYNKVHKDAIDMVGIGTYSTDRKNATETHTDGKHYIYGIGGYDGTNPDSSKDVATVVEGKQETLVSGTNIKTINGNSLLGEGDIQIEGGGSVDAYTKQEADAKFATIQYVDEKLSIITTKLRTI